jgi:hypothetical protein
MPRFYFDVREGTRFVPDEVGLAYDNLDAAETGGPPGLLVRRRLKNADPALICCRV